MSNPNIARDSSTTFKKGQSGNPKGGIKKAWTMTGLYISALEEENETGVPRKVIVARKLVQLAERGDVIAIKELGNRIDGMPQQDVTSKGEKITTNAIVFTDFKNETESQ